MEALLSSASTHLIEESRDEEPLLSAVQRRNLILHPAKTLEPTCTPHSIVAAFPLIEITSLNDVLQVLKSDPPLTQLSSILSFLTRQETEGSALLIHRANAISSQIVKTLVDVTIPNFWEVLKGEEWKKNKEALLRCLRSVTGLGGIVARLNVLIKLLETPSGEEKGKGENRSHVIDLLEVLEGVMGRRSFIWGVWSTIEGMEKVEMKRMLIWKEFVALVAGSRVLSGTMWAEKALLTADGHERPRIGNRWVGECANFCEWLGGGIVYAVERLQAKRKEEDEAGWKAIRLLWWRSYGLAWWGEVVESVTISLLKPTQNLQALKRLLSPCHSHERQRYIASLFQLLGKKYLVPVLFTDSNWWIEDGNKVSGIAAVIKEIMSFGQDFEHAILEWTLSSAEAGTPIGIRRAIVAALQNNQKHLNFLLEKSLQEFGHKLWIKHTPIQTQEVMTQLMLLIAGELYRRYPSVLKQIVHSPLYLNAISNRLASQSERPRFLGMILGESLSNLTDPEGSKLDFKMEELQSEEALWWKELVNIQDKVGSIEDLFVSPKSEQPPKEKKQRLPSAIKPFGLTSKIISIVELVDEEEDVREPPVQPIEEVSEEEESDDEFTPYTKPDEDVQDSEDDPTLITRNKEAPPVYIRDLLRLLRAHDDYDKQLLALQHAPLLIRRKAAFGTEVSDHLFELASNFAGMHDRFDTPNFQEMRIQALIALIVAFPVRMGQWSAEAFFEGDYSLNQRAVLLTTIGMGARELAGYKDEDLPFSEKSGKGKAPGELFPSKILPGKMHEIYSPVSSSEKSHTQPSPANTPVRQLDFLAQNLERSIIQPMASEAAEKTTPSLLKAIQVRTFSKRMEIEKKRPKPAASKLGKVVAEAFFFPLVGRWWIKLKETSTSTFASGGKGEFGKRRQELELPQFQPFLLSQFLKTLALVLHASGPSTTTLPQMTREFWDLLLSLRSYSSTNDEPVALEALLFGFLTLLELNIESGESGKIKLVDEFGKELVETHEWVGQVFDNAPGGESVVKGFKGGILGLSVTGDEAKIRYLSAAVLIKTKEVMEGYERRLMGFMMSLE